MLYLNVCKNNVYALTYNVTYDINSHYLVEGYKTHRILTDINPY